MIQNIFNARNDDSAVNKANKKAKKLGVGVWYLAEWFDITEEDRLIIYKGKRV